jgi:hypothetical protein
MNIQAYKTKENKIQSVANSVSQKKYENISTFQFVDNRPETVVQRKLINLANESSQVIQLGRTGQPKATPRENVPDALKSSGRKIDLKEQDLEEVSKPSGSTVTFGGEKGVLQHKDGSASMFAWLNHRLPIMCTWNEPVEGSSPQPGSVEVNNGQNHFPLGLGSRAETDRGPAKCYRVPQRLYSTHPQEGEEQKLALRPDVEAMPSRQPLEEERNPKGTFATDYAKLHHGREEHYRKIWESTFCVGKKHNWAKFSQCKEAFDGLEELQSVVAEWAPASSAKKWTQEEFKWRAPPMKK